MHRTKLLPFAMILCATTSAGYTDCGGVAPTTELPPEPESCADHDEAECAADPRCEAVYSSDCACPEICIPDPNGGCLPCDCPPGQSTFSCDERSACDESLVCDALYCPYGYAVDESGCPTCGCVEPPSGCEGLVEEQCLSTPGCAPIYGGGGGGAPCTCPVCDPAEGEECPPCTCDASEPDPGFRPGPPQDGYVGCTSTDPCAGLSEEACVGTPGCHPEYVGPQCFSLPCDPSSDPACDGEAPPPPCDPLPASYAGCFIDAEPPPVGCTSDAECPGGYCELFGGGAAPCPEGGDCGRPIPPPPGGICVAVSCDDGEAVLCDALPPTCSAGQVVAARNGCWACVDARTCT